MKSLVPAATSAMLVAVLGIGASAQSQPQQAAGGANTPAPPVQTRSADPRIDTWRRLSRAVTVELTEARLEDVVQFLRDYTGAEIDPVWSDSGSGEGLDKERRISITTRDLPAITVLERILNKVNDDVSGAATWQFIEGGGIEIPTYLSGNRLYSVFETAGFLLTASEELTSGGLLFEVVSARRSGKPDAPVGTFQVGAVQRVLLARRGG